MTMVVGHFKAGADLDDWTPITSLPSGCRPKKQLRVRQWNESGKGYSVLIGPDGAVQLYGATGLTEGDTLFINVIF